MDKSNETKASEAVTPEQRFNWEQYQTRVNESAAAAEKHLEIPPGSISSIATDSDFIATVKAYAVVEPILNDLIATWPPHQIQFGALAIPDRNEKFRGFVTALNMGGSTGKLRLAEELGLLTGWQVSFIRALSRVRNRYAHNVKNMHRSLNEMLTEEQQNNQQIVAQLTGLMQPLPSHITALNTNLILKMLMYHRLADYLASALDTLRPPPAPAGGFLNTIFGTMAAAEPPDSFKGDGAS